MMTSDQWELFGKAVDKLVECAQIGLDNDVHAQSVNVRLAYSISLLESFLDRRQAELDY